MNYKNGLIVMVLTVALPLSQAHASVTELGFTEIDFPAAAYIEESMAIGDFIPPIVQNEVGSGEHPFYDFILKEEDVIETGPQPDELQLILDEELTQAVMGEEVLPIETTIPGAKAKGRFWTKGKVLLTTGVLLSVGVLFGVLAFAFSGSGSGNGSGSGSGGGGGAPNNPNSNPNDPNPNPDPNTPLVTCPGGDNCIPDNGDDPIGPPGIDVIPLPNPRGIPHNPEPSTLLLLGLGLFMPFLKRKSS